MTDRRPGAVASIHVAGVDPDLVLVPGEEGRLLALHEAQASQLQSTLATESHGTPATTVHELVVSQTALFHQVDIFLRNGCFGVRMTQQVIR